MKGREHQAELNRLAREAAKDSERKELAATLHGELMSLSRQYNNYLTALHIQELVYRELARTRTPATHDFTMPKRPTPVYEANIHRIGLLGPSVAADVAEVYGIMSTGVEYPAERIDPEMLADVLKGIRENQPEFNQDALHVSSRLVAIQTGTADPGSLLKAQQRRKKPAKTVNDEAPDQK